MRLEPRARVPLWLGLAAPVAAIGFALLLCSLLIVWAGKPVAQAYGLVLNGALGSRFALTETLTRATPLIFTGLAVAVAFRARLWNIGAEGQFFAGAIAASWLGTMALPLPAVVLVPLLFLAGALAGGLLLLGPALMKLRLQVDEVVTTLLLNFVLILVVDWLIFGPWKDPMALGWPQGPPVVAEARLPKLLARSSVHVGLLIGLGLAVAAWLMVRFTTLGYAIRAVGHNPGASAFAGIPVDATVVWTALLSGGLAGMAGVSELLGFKGYLTTDLSAGFGYAGIAVAMLAALHPLGVIPSALFIAGIYVGADSMSRKLEVSSYIADVISATALLAVLGSLLLVRFRIRLRS
ncbi:MAG TPA: ABC transporter permease [Geminicoccaceae bacterium]